MQRSGQELHSLGYGQMNKLHYNRADSGHKLAFKLIMGNNHDDINRPWSKYK